MASEKKRVLIVDDESDLITLLSARLVAAGFTVTSATDGLEGLLQARALKPDLILLDVMLPKLDGYHVCRLLKFDDRFQNIPILFLTARAQARDQAVAAEVGANGFLVKPFRSEELMEKIRGLLQE